MTTPIIFSDLDDTIFQTARKMDPRPSEDANPASFANNGSHSYMNAAQDKMFTWLNDTTRFIPVTARSTDALSRCTLPFKDYQVASNGAVILEPNGDIDYTWMHRTESISEEMSGMLMLLHDFVEERNKNEELRHWIVREVGMPIYYCVKSNTGEEKLDAIEGKLRDIANGAFLVHRNGNNISMTPSEISKRAAVEYLIEKIGTAGSPIWGMGDSLTDLPFMEACQMMVIPTDSQAHKSFK
jgi:hydroxymethylpyrimidine pyrophosphatase-like HAD family hydrolase